MLSALALVVPVLSACSISSHGRFRTVAMAPGGLPWGEELVRRSLTLGSYEQAFERTQTDERSMPDDALLRAVFRGQVAYYAGRWEESAQAFAEAERLTDERFTKSVSRGVLSMFVNDNALKYAPPRTERLFARYYAMMSRVQAGDIDGATVEARRLSALLEQSMHDVEPAERATHAALRDVAGGVFEAAAQWNDAGVAYRNAALLRGTPRSAVDSMQITRPVGDSATLLLVVESGFVAHYVQQTLAIPLSDDEARRVQRSRAPDIPNTPDLSVSPDFALKPQVGNPMLPPAARPVSDSKPGVARSRPPESDEEVKRGAAPSRGAQFLAALDLLPDGGVFVDREHGLSRTRYLGDRRAYRTWLEIAWPALVRPDLPNAPVQFGMSVELPRTADEAHGSQDGTAGGTTEGTTEGTMASNSEQDVVREDSATARREPWRSRAEVPLRGVMTADISDAFAADARRQRAARLARLTARTVTRVAVVEAVRDQHGEFAGALAGMLASGLERADTRGWHLLPGRLSLVRVTIPAGKVSSRLVVGAGPNGLPIEVQPFTARAGMAYVLGARVWRDPAGTPQSVARGS